MPRTVIVVGAGIIGATAALRLVEEGFSVTLCDPRQPGSTDAASFGNGGWISPASILPMSMPGLWRKVPGFLLDREGPLTIDIASLPRLMPWLVRFLAAGFTENRVRKTAKALNWLVSDSPQRHQAMARAIGHGDLVRQNGLVYAYPSREAFLAEALGWQLRRENGVVFEEWDEPTLRDKMPALADSFRFAAFLPQGAHCVNTGRYVASIVEHAKTLGLEYREGRVSGLLPGRHPRIVMENGDSLNADHVILAAGVHSARLMSTIDVRVPMASERGYHVTVTDDPTPFDIPVMPSTGKMANTPTEMGLRLSGQVELATIDKAPDWKRAEILRRHAWSTYPYLSQSDPSALKMWMGHRPSTPDSMPLIGPFTRHPRIIAAFGHGHVGIASAPKTAELLLAAINDNLPAEAAAFSTRRFGA